MAKPGPAPKAAERRQRRNAAPEVTLLPAAGYTGEYPKLPTTYTISIWDNATQRSIDVKVKFLASSKEYYEIWATSPQATQFSRVTWLTLKRLTMLVDQCARGDSKLAGEIRQTESKLGATPEDMAKLKWAITDDEAAASASSSKAKVSPRRSKPDARHLALVT